MNNFQEYSTKVKVIENTEKNNFKKNMALNKNKLNKLYNERVIERGYQYYLNRNIIYSIKYNNFLYGTVSGGSKYKVKIDLTTLTGECTCGYKNNCKHAYALILSYFNDNYINGIELLSKLDNMPKEDLLKIIKDLIVDNYLWDDHLVEENELELAKKMLKLVNLERKNIFTFKSYLSNEFLNKATEEQILEFIKYFLNSKINHDIEEKYYEEILHNLVSEIFGRKNELYIKQLLKISKSKADLWMVNDYIIDNEYYYLLD
ncbi:SWIM zinc finger family protein [Methanococcus voltae]|uniref:Zn finger protein n=2 Tax=Methanococcus voltae TaxID=2188 RepID=A0ABT2EX10_METVO|nr:SWIM zinc finger family protein [Methanococcus voltae]MBP2172305.1 putative Zn finger protein [Methanococcus voltae]MBP2200739.1 putative Zn finger protein [Methanococcus voltae]MCS3921463.1 putative Zn finger protein [Methanococcus voltae PS]